MGSKYDKAIKSTQSDLKLINELVEAQQGAMTGIENKGIQLQQQYQTLSDQLKQLESIEAELQQRVTTNEQAIEAIDSFRRTVNQELLRLKGGA